MSTLTGDRARLVTIAATAVAQAPVPQASVSPAPRSNVRNFKRSSTIVATLTLIRSGKAGSFSIFGPSSSSGTSRASGTKKTRCGLPTLSAIGCSSSPHAIGSAAVSIG